MRDGPVSSDNLTIVSKIGIIMKQKKNLQLKAALIISVLNDRSLYCFETLPAGGTPTLDVHGPVHIPYPCKYEWRFSQWPLFHLLCP